MSEAAGMNRREWLRRAFMFGTVGSVFTILGGILVDVWIGAGRFSSNHWREIGEIDPLSSDGAIPYPELKVAVIRRGARLAALSLECPHLGCLVNAVDQGFFCPCHGSRFGPMGELWSGPATKSLFWHAVRSKQNRLWVLTGRRLEQPDWLSLNLSGKEEA